MEMSNLVGHLHMLHPLRLQYRTIIRPISLSAIDLISLLPGEQPHH